MSLPISIKQKACEGLLHFKPKKTLARELGISLGAVRDWAIFIENDNFEWVTSTMLPRDPDRREKAVVAWFANSSLGYAEIARRFGIRPSSLFTAVVNRLNQLPVMLRPKRKRSWEPPEAPSLGKLKMTFDKLSDIPSDRPLTERERKALFNELKKAREEEKARLVCAQCLLEVGMESCKDELKKKLMKQQLEQINAALASL